VEKAIIAKSKNRKSIRRTTDTTVPRFNMGTPSSAGESFHGSALGVEERETIEQLT
jgi:hypothetical protein